MWWIIQQIWQILLSTFQTHPLLPRFSLPAVMLSSLVCLCCHPSKCYSFCRGSSRLIWSTSSPWSSQSKGNFPPLNCSKPLIFSLRIENLFLWLLVISCSVLKYSIQCFKTSWLKGFTNLGSKCFSNMLWLLPAFLSPSIPQRTDGPLVRHDSFYSITKPQGDWSHIVCYEYPAT